MTHGSRAGAIAWVAAAASAGLAQALSIADPWTGQPRWWLQMLAMVALVWLVQAAPTPRAAAARAIGFGIGWLAGTFWWMFISLHVYGGLPAVLAVLAVLALAGLLSLYYGAAAAAARFAALARPIPRALLWASVWTLAELARGLWFTGLPWGAVGYAHVDGPLAALAPWLGVYGIGAVAVFVSALLVGLWPARRAGPQAMALLLVAGVCGLLARYDQADPAGAMPQPLRVTLLQGNIPQDEKFQPGIGVEQSLFWYGEQLRRAQASLVVAPETALPLLPDQLPPGYWHALQQRFASGAQSALIGMPLGDMQRGYTNAAVGLSPDRAEPFEYAKHHLVPFGEFIPPLFRWFTAMMNIPLGDFTRGAVGQPSMALAGHRLAPNICYEDLFGEELAVRFRDPAQAPTIFVNLSNIAWFGDTVAIDQHLAISRMRSLEFRRPMLRATNTGATAIIDAAGRVTDALPRLTRGSLTGDVYGRSDITPYAWWVARAGLAPLWVPALVFALWALWRRRR